MHNSLLQKTLVIFVTIFAAVIFISCSGSTSTELAQFRGNLVGLPDVAGDQESRLTFVEVVHPDTAEVLSIELLETDSTTYEISAPAGFGMIVASAWDLPSAAFHVGFSDRADLAAGESRSVDISMVSQESVAGVSGSSTARFIDRAWFGLGGRSVFDVGVVHAQDIDARPIIEIRMSESAKQSGWRGELEYVLKQSGKFRIMLPPDVLRFIDREKERQRLGINRPQDRMDFRERLVPDFIVQGTMKTGSRPRFTNVDAAYGEIETTTVDIEIIDARTGEVVASTTYSEEGGLRRDVSSDIFGRSPITVFDAVIEKLLALPEAETFVTKPAPLPDEFYAASVLPMPRARSLMGMFGELDYFEMNIYRIEKGLREASSARWRPTDPSRGAAEPNLAAYQGHKADFRLTSSVEEDGDITVIVDYALQPSVESAEANLIWAAVANARAVPKLYQFDEAYEIESFEGDQTQEAVIWGRVGRMVIRVLGVRILSCVEGCNSRAGLDLVQDAVLQGAVLALQALPDTRIIRSTASLDRPSSVGEINREWHLTRTGHSVEKGLRNQTDFEADLRDSSSESLPGPPGQPTFGTFLGTYDDPPDMPELPGNLPDPPTGN